MEPSKRLSASEVRRLLSFLRHNFREGTLDLQNQKLPPLDDNTTIDIGTFCIAFLLKKHLKPTDSEIDADT